MARTYEYQPLSTNSIRLLSLSKGSSDADRLKGHLRHIDLSKATEHEALSYCWGQSVSSSRDKIRGMTLKPGENIALDDYERYRSGKKVNAASFPVPEIFLYSDTHPSEEAGSIIITPNCAAALYRLRCPDRSRTLWIDAICINQSNSTEKEQQIPLMGDVYRKAKQVIIWLGEPDCDAAERAFKMIEPLVTIYSQDQVAKSLIDPIEVDILKSTQELLLAHISSLPYWERTWTLQELAFATNLSVHFGSDFLPWETFQKIFVQFTGVHRGDEHRLDGFFAHCNAQLLIHMMLMTEGTVYAGAVQTLEKNQQDMKVFRYDDGLILPQALLGCVCKQQATDPKDKVFGIFKILEYYSPGLLNAPDYSRTTCDVYEEAIKVIMISKKADCGLKMLRLAPSDGRNPSLPSWVPDLNDTSSEEWPQKSTLWRIEYGYQTIKDFGTTFRFISPGKLEVDCKIVGQITQICDRATSEGPQRDIMNLDDSEYIRVPIWDPLILGKWAKLISSCTETAVPLKDIPEVIERSIKRRIQQRGNAQNGMENTSSHKWPKKILDPTTELGEAFLLSLPLWNHSLAGQNVEIISQPEIEKLARSLVYCYETLRPLQRSRDQALFSIGKSWFGFAIDDIHVGDFVALFPNLDAPAIFRTYGEEGHFKLVGFVFVPGLMEERAWDGLAYVADIMGSPGESKWSFDQMDDRAVTLI